MTFYADLPARRTGQVLADLGVLAWCVVWALVGRFVHDMAMGLAAPGRQLASAGSGFGSRMTQAADGVDDLPLIGDRVAVPFRAAAGTGADLERTGQDLVTAVERFALVVGWTTALVPILVVVGVWALVRGRFVRRATAARRFIDGAADLDLFALRALTNQPMHVLARISPDPGGAWRRGEPETIRALGSLELRSVGLRPPTDSRGSTPR